MNKIKFTVYKKITCSKKTKKDWIIYKVIFYNLKQFPNWKTYNLTFSNTEKRFAENHGFSKIFEKYGNSVIEQIKNVIVDNLQKETVINE